MTTYILMFHLRKIFGLRGLFGLSIVFFSLSVSADGVFGKMNLSYGNAIEVYVARNLTPSFDADIDDAYRAEQLELSTAINEISFVQLHIVNNTGSDISFSHVDKEIQIDILEIASIFDLGGKSIEGVLDPLWPALNGVLEISAHSSIDVLLKVKAVKSQIAGVRADYMEFVGEGLQVQLPVLLEVHDVDLGQVAELGTQLFNIDIQSVSYYFGLPAWHPWVRSYVLAMQQVMADYRISPSKTPFMPRVVSQDMPEVIKPDQGELNELVFGPGDHVELSAPRFEELNDEFAFTIDFKAKSDGDYELLSYVWNNRRSGFRLGLSRGKLSFELGDGVNFNNIFALSFQPNDEYHQISVELASEQINVLIDGVEKGSFNFCMCDYEFAYGGSATIRNVEGSLSVRNMLWETKSAGTDSGLFQQNVLDLVSMLDSLSSKTDIVYFSGTDQEYFELSARWVQDRGLWANQIDESVGIADIDSRVAYLDSIGLSGKYHVKLPRDEGVVGAAVDRNITYSKKFGKSGAPVFHTFGSMGRIDVSGRRKILEKYANYVDIYSIRPRLLILDNEFFDPRLTAVSLYLHDTHWAPNAESLKNARSIFWYMAFRGIDKASYWNVSSWFQPIKSETRVGRYIEPHGKDYSLVKRNPSGIHSGVLFYPGKTEALESLQLIAWVQGIQDYLLYKKVERMAAGSKSSVSLDAFDKVGSWAGALGPMSFRKDVGKFEFDTIRSELFEISKKYSTH